MPAWSNRQLIAIESARLREQFLRDLPFRLANECCYCRQLTAIDEGNLCEAGNFYCEHCWDWWEYHMWEQHITANERLQFFGTTIAYNELKFQNAWNAVRLMIEPMYKKIKESRWLLWVLFCIMAATANRKEPMKPQEPLGFDLHIEPIPGSVCIYIYTYIYRERERESHMIYSFNPPKNYIVIWPQPRSILQNISVPIF